jgi:hypothetical protein
MRFGTGFNFAETLEVSDLNQDGWPDLIRGAEIYLNQMGPVTP